MSDREIPQADYLKHALDISEAEQAKIDGFEQWLPPEIIDAHAHSNLDVHIDSIPEKTFNHMMSTFPSFSIDESHELNRVFYPNSRVRSLRFPHVFRGINHHAANEYLLDHTSLEDRAALYGLSDDVPYTLEMMDDPRVAALKMYPSYNQPTATTVYEYFKPEILEKAEALGIPIILHPPKVITQSVADVLGVARDFPNLHITLAHLGLTKFDIPGLQDAYDRLAEETTVNMDTALNPSVDVHFRAISTLGIKRVLFGTDQPLDLLRSVPYMHPEKGERIATVYPYHWQNPTEHASYNHLARNALHSHWLCLDAIRGAIERLPSEEQDEAKQNIFHDNAQKLYGFTE